MTKKIEKKYIAKAGFHNQKIGRKEKGEGVDDCQDARDLAAIGYLRVNPLYKTKVVNPKPEKVSDPEPQEPKDPPKASKKTTKKTTKKKTSKK